MAQSYLACIRQLQRGLAACGENIQLTIQPGSVYVQGDSCQFGLMGSAEVAHHLDEIEENF